MTHRSILVGIALAMVLGAVASAVGWIAVARSGNRAVNWRRLAAGLFIAFGTTTAGILLGVLTYPDGSGELPSWLVGVIGTVLMPGIWAMSIFGRHSLDTVPYFGGFALNVAIWSFIAYLLIEKRRARA